MSFDLVEDLLDITHVGRNYPQTSHNGPGASKETRLRSPEAKETRNRYIMIETPPLTNEVVTPVVADNPGSKYPFASVSLTGADMAAILGKVNELKGLLPPMPDLTPLERRRMSKLGTKTRGFADLALETAKTDPGVLPQSISLDTFVAQDVLLHDLSLVQTHVTDLKFKLDDALFQIGNYIYGVSRVVYAVMKTDAAKARLQEQKAAMAQRFAKSRSQSTVTNTPQA